MSPKKSSQRKKSSSPPRISSSSFSSQNSRRLYDILCVSPDATQAQIAKAYRLLALRLHPDKAKGDDNAHNSFLQLHKAYELLRDPVKRKRYDRTGSEEEESEEFEKAYDWFRATYGTIDTEDIDSFQDKYRFSDMETEDLTDHYNRCSGDISEVLECIPFSTPDDVPRFIDTLKQLIKNKKVKSYTSFERSLPSLRTNAGKYRRKVVREAKAAQKKLDQRSQEESSGGDLTSLVKAIQTNRSKRNLDGFFDALEKKYAEEEEQAGNKRKETSEAKRKSPSSKRKKNNL